MQAQKELELRQKEEEDKLMNEMLTNRESVMAEVQKEVEKQWEVKLKELTEKFERDTAKKGSKKSDKKVNHSQ